MDDAILKDVFTYHPPTEAQREIYNRINEVFLTAAQAINSLIPDGPGKTVAIRKLSDARMQANACVALDGRF